MKRDARVSAYSKNARIDKRNIHKAKHFVIFQGRWVGFASKKHADRTRNDPANPTPTYARGDSLSAIRELIERNER